MKKHLKARYELFCHLLIEARRKSGLSQEDVADKLGRPQSYISKCESGARRMDVIEFIEVMKAIGMDPTVLIKKLK
jgi:ribosome-binding protein aMBF1 (putative translation factor)